MERRGGGGGKVRYARRPHTKSCSHAKTDRSRKISRPEMGRFQLIAKECGLVDN